MRNVSLNIGFRIDKVKLNEYRNHVFLSKYESTSETHVNIKMFAEKADDFECNVLVYDKAGIAVGFHIYNRFLCKCHAHTYLILGLYRFTIFSIENMSADSLSITFFTELLSFSTLTDKGSWKFFAK